MRIFLTWLTWLLIVNFNASTWAQNAAIPTGVCLSFEDEMAELNRLKESAQLHEIIKFLDAHGLDMISRVKSEEATRLAFTIMGAVRAGRARSTSRHCKLQTNTTTKSCLASFEARRERIYPRANGYPAGERSISTTMVGSRIVVGCFKHQYQRDYQFAMHTHHAA